MPVAGYDAVVADPKGVVAQRFGLKSGGRVVIRPDHSPTLDELSASIEQLNRQELLAQQPNSAMLVINGADDYFIPQSDALIFQGRPNTEVHLLEGTGHCAMSKAPEVVPKIIAWLAGQFA